MAPLLLLASGTSARRGVALGFCFGLGFFGSLLIWVSIVGWIAWALLVVLQSAFLGAFGAAWARLSRLGSTTARVAGAGAAWVALEFLRQLVPDVGFPWGQLAQSQHNVPWLLRAAGVGGGWTVAFLIVCVNAMLAEAWRARGWGRGAVAARLGVAAALLAVPALLPRPTATGDPVRVAIVQGNVPRQFEGSSLDKQMHILRAHRDVTSSIAGSEPELVVWPESSVGLDPSLYPDATEAIRDAARAVDAAMIVGGDEHVDARHYRVVAFQVDPSGEIVDRYRKTHLVAFGEYVPARRFLGWIPMLDQVPRDAIAGSEGKVFDVAGGRVAPLISFEGDFGSLARSRVGAGGRLLVVATNTSTWGTSWASAQHVAFSQVRAAENGVWVAHAALSGISAFVAPDGTIVDQTSLWTEDALVRDVRFASGVTLYARTGDWLPLASLVVCAVLLAAGVRASRRSTVV